LQHGPVQSERKAQQHHGGNLDDTNQAG
jgi:hypothetical protein